MLGLWKGDLVDILEKLFIWSSLYHFLFHRSDHCNHAEGSTCSWMPPEPCSGSSCKRNILILNINTSLLLCWSLYCYVKCGQYQMCDLWIFCRWREHTNELLGQTLTLTLNLARTLTRWVFSLSSRIQHSTHLSVSYCMFVKKLIFDNSSFWFFLTTNHHPDNNYSCNNYNCSCNNYNYSCRCNNYNCSNYNSKSTATATPAHSSTPWAVMIYDWSTCYIYHCISLYDNYHEIKI